MEIYSIGSSSAGNSYIVKIGGANVLLDLGLSARKIVTACENCGISICDIDAICITHEHIDHVRSVRAIAKKCPEAVFYVSRGTYENCDSFKDVDSDRISFVSAGMTVSIKEARISCFPLSHDAAEPVGFSFEEDDKRMSVVTDTGIITEEIYDEIRASNSLIFEANHEENLLMVGEYPYSVKMRIKSDYGHLSNVACGEALSRLLDYRESDSKLDIMLAHLSDKNNTPYQARLTIEDILRQHGYECGKHYNLSIAAKEGITAL